jgi:hypothetical protein
LPVRELFDVLEKLRPEVRAEMLRGDEADLFNFANNFTIRHLNEIQKGNYPAARQPRPAHQLSPLIIGQHDRHRRRTRSWQISLETSTAEY